MQAGWAQRLALIEEVNAWATPGYMNVYRGLLPYLNSEAELAAVRKVLRKGDWLRPCQIASLTNLKTAVVLSVLRVLEAERRDYTIPRLHHGANRTRKTSRLIIEYRLRAAADLTLFPSFLLCPSKEPAWQPSSD